MKTYFKVLAGIAIMSVTALAGEKPWIECRYDLYGKSHQLTLNSIDLTSIKANESGGHDAQGAITADQTSSPASLMTSGPELRCSAGKLFYEASKLRVRHSYGQFTREFTIYLCDGTYYSEYYSGTVPAGSLGTYDSLGKCDTEGLEAIRNTFGIKCTTDVQCRNPRD
jgi:hypothetical protein